MPITYCAPLLSLTHLGTRLGACLSAWKPQSARSTVLPGGHILRLLLSNLMQIPFRQIFLTVFSSCVSTDWLTGRAQNVKTSEEASS